METFRHMPQGFDLKQKTKMGCGLELHCVYVLHVGSRNFMESVIESCSILFGYSYNLMESFH